MKLAMTPDASSSRPHVVGREDELSRLDAFLDGLVDGPAALRAGRGVGDREDDALGPRCASDARSGLARAVDPPRRVRGHAFLRGSRRSVGGGARPVRVPPRSAADRARGRAAACGADGAAARSSRGVRGGADRPRGGVVPRSRPRGARRRPVARRLDRSRAGVRRSTARRRPDRLVDRDTRGGGGAPAGARPRVAGGTHHATLARAAHGRRTVRARADAPRCRVAASGAHELGGDIGREPVLRVGDRASHVARRHTCDGARPPDPAEPSRRSGPRSGGHACRRRSRRSSYMPRHRLGRPSRWWRPRSNDRTSSRSSPRRSTPGSSRATTGSSRSCTRSTARRSTPTRHGHIVIGSIVVSAPSSRTRSSARVIWRWRPTGPTRPPPRRWSRRRRTPEPAAPPSPGRSSSRWPSGSLLPKTARTFVAADGPPPSVISSPAIALARSNSWDRSSGMPNRAMNVRRRSSSWAGRSS